jgi:hypothetical protein
LLAERGRECGEDEEEIESDEGVGAMRSGQGMYLFDWDADPPPPPLAKTKTKNPEHEDDSDSSSDSSDGILSASDDAAEPSPTALAQLEDFVSTLDTKKRPTPSSPDPPSKHKRPCLQEKT